MKPYAELLEFNQPNPIRKQGFTRIRGAFPGLMTTRASGAMEEGEHYADPERIMEFAGRWDYGQNNARKLGEMSKARRLKAKTPMEVLAYGDEEEEYEVPIIQKYISMGHESMIEMGDATFFLECSRVVSHELVRHRLASFQQESQRFVKYDAENEEDLFYTPDGLDDIQLYDEWDDGEFGTTLRMEEGYSADEMLEDVYSHALNIYKEMRRKGVSPQIARYLFPNATRTRLVMKANVREWRHILKLRLNKSAQPEMQELMQQVYDQLVDIFPNAMKGVLGGERGVR